MRLARLQRRHPLIFSAVFRAGKGSGSMVRSVQLIGAVAAAFALAISVADAQTPHPSALHARAKHGVARPKDEGRQITVRKSTPSWLTLGTSAPVGSRNGYVVDTFNQPSPVEGSFSGYRGRERLDANRFDGPGVPLFRF